MASFFSKFMHRLILVAFLWLGSESQAHSKQLPVQILQPIADAKSIKDPKNVSLVSIFFSYEPAVGRLLAHTQQMSLLFYSPHQKKLYTLALNPRHKANIWALPKDSYQFLAIQWLSSKKQRLTWEISKAKSQVKGPLPLSQINLSSYQYIDLGAWSLGLSQIQKTYLRQIRTGSLKRGTQPRKNEKALTLSAKKLKTPLVLNAKKRQKKSLAQRPLSALEIAGAEKNINPSLSRLNIDYTRKRLINLRYRISIENKFSISNKLTSYIERFDGRFRGCYAQSLDIDARISGQIIFSFKLSSNPIVIGQPRLRASNIKQRSLINCLAAELRGLSLPVGAGQMAYMIFRLDSK